MLNFIKKKFKKVLFLIKYFITVIKYYTSPGIRPHALRFYEDSLPYAPREKISAWNLYEKDELVSSYNHFKKYFPTSIFLFYKEQILEYALKKSFKNEDSKTSLYLEFGVYKGDSVNFLAKKLQSNIIYGFDSFEGIDHDWSGYYLPEGFFNLEKKIPKLNSNVIPVVGLIQNTLPKFLKENEKKISFIHIDTDIYESAKTILSLVKPRLGKNSIIVFDELYNFPGWNVGEYRALRETFQENEYKFLAFAKDGQQAVIQIL